MKYQSHKLFAGVLVLSSAIFSMTAQAAKHPAKMTCKEFIELDEVSRPKVVYWAEGFNRNGDAADEIFDFVDNDRLVPVIVEDCTRNPKHSFISKVKKAESKINKG